MAASKRTSTKPTATARQAAKSVSQDPMSLQQPLCADEGIAQLRKQYVARAREKLRAKLLPELENVICLTPSGPTRNKLADAQATLLQVLEDLSS